MTERNLIFNFCALYEVIFAEEEILPEKVLHKYGLLDLTKDEIKQLEVEEMQRLKKEEGLTYREIARRFGLTDSGVYRRMKRWEGEYGAGSIDIVK